MSGPFTAWPMTCKHTLLLRVFRQLRGNYTCKLPGIKSWTLQGAVIREAVAADVQWRTYLLMAFPLRRRDPIPLSAPCASRSC